MVASQEQDVVEDDASESTEAPIDYRSKLPTPARKPSLFRSLGFRRTIIPILLTTGVMLFAMGSGKWIVDEQAPLGRLPAWSGVLLLLVGVMLVAAGVANMLMVRNELSRASAPNPGGGPPGSTE